jgi:hypothetical protein
MDWAEEAKEETEVSQDMDTGLPRLGLSREAPMPAAPRAAKAVSPQARASRYLNPESLTGP